MTRPYAQGARVHARPRAESLVLHLDGETRALVCSPDLDLSPGDLCRVTLSADGRTVASAERVFRPRVSPFERGRETRRFAIDGLGALNARSLALAAIRSRMAEWGFVEVETPSIRLCPGMDLHLSAFEVRDPAWAPPKDHFGWLTTSPEFHLKRLLVGGVPRCFSLARCFRSGELGARHQPEFTMLEWYRAWEDLPSVMRDTESLVRSVAASLGTPEALHHRGRAISLAGGDFPVLTLREAFALHCPEAGDPVALAERDEERYYSLLGSAVEPMLGRERPTWVQRFPAVHASLAKRCDDDPSVCHRAELYVDGVELCNGFDELTDPDEQRSRFVADQRQRAARGLPVYPLDEAFLAALEEGMPPSGGNALGFDRLLALATGADDLADVMAFPTER